MALGFPASYKEEIDLTACREIARDAAVYAFQALGWAFEVESFDRFSAKVPISASSWGETITVSLETPGAITIRSVCRVPQFFDWGKNKRNVEEFVAHFAPKERREAQLHGTEPEFFDSHGKTPLERAIDEID